MSSTKKNILECVREDDFVEYYLFPKINYEENGNEEIVLTTLLNKINEFVKDLIKDYLWHKDPFKLTVRPSITNILSSIEGQKEYLPPHLYGISHYGDNIEDEWFMVYILREITKKFSGLIGKIHDVDEEFLLIEAANYLPNWASPETCNNRVYLCDGVIHLIEPNTKSNDEITISEALTHLRNNSNTAASTEIQSAINKKISMYSHNLNANFYNCTVYVPIGVATLLKQCPNLVAPAVQAFCNRDSIDMKACKAMKYFPPENRVYTRIKFTKCLYAMLTHSKYVPDRRTGWNLPPINSPQYKSHSLGVKLACGFEILAAQAKPSADIETDKGWHNYLNSLKEKNYFNELMEGSKGYNELLNKAKEYYINHRDSMQYSPLIGQEILQLIKTSNSDYDEFKNNESNLPVDDDDSWLNVSPEELDKLLEETYGQKKFVKVNNMNASGFTEKVVQFLEHVSDIDGAEFPPERPPRKHEKSKSVSFTPDTKENASKPAKVNFDPNGFACAVQNILNFVIPEDDSWDMESGSDMSEYEDDNYVKEESYEEVKTKMQQYMEEMDRELASTTIGESFEKKNGDGFDDIESFQPVDIDVNALKNILESYKSQLGEAGPSSNMLGPMGIHLDAKNDIH